MLPRARDPSATCESPTRSRASHPSRDPCSSTKHQRFPAPGKQQARSSQPCRDKHSWEQAASGGSALCQSKVSFAFSKLRSKTAARRPARLPLEAARPRGAPGVAAQSLTPRSCRASSKACRPFPSTARSLTVASH